MSLLNPNDPYHARDRWLRPDEALDRFRECMKACDGDGYEAAVMLYQVDPHASNVLDGAYSLEEAVALAGAYSETADGDSDAELLSVPIIPV